MAKGCLLACILAEIPDTVLKMLNQFLGKGNTEKKYQNRDLKIAFIF